MLIGAGAAGQMILRDINSGRANGKVVCIIDDNVNKQGRFVENVRVVGGRESILQNVEKYHVNKIFLAIPREPRFRTRKAPQSIRILMRFGMRSGRESAQGEP